MQTTINNTPVWITHRSGTDFSFEEIENELGYAPDDMESPEVCDAITALKGYYYACCSPGCLPDSDFYGPYATEDEAYKAAQAFYND